MIDQLEVEESENDGVKLMEFLSQCISTEDVLSTFAQIHGPWAFIYYQVCYIAY